MSETLPSATNGAPTPANGEAPRPYTLVAELTYRCPLRCVYCSNPTDFGRHDDALTTDDWLRVFREAEALGVVTLNLTGGEPLLRDDLERLVEGARALDLYTNLITSGIPLARERLAALKTCGLDNVQVSIQDVERAASDRIAGLRAFDRKLEVARWVKELGFPLTLNVVLHRENLDRVADIVALAESLHADRLELANTQYLGWALLNRRTLLPTRAPRGDDCRVGWRFCSSRRITTPTCRRRAWTAGAAASSSWRPTASCCRVTRRTRCRGSSSTTRAHGRSATSGATRRRSARSAARRGCRSRVAPAIGARSISAAVAARPITSPAMRRPPTPRARWRRPTRW